MTVVLQEETTPLLPSSPSLTPLQINGSPRKATIWHILIPSLVIGFCTVGIAAPSIEIYTLIFCTRYYQNLGDYSLIPIERCAIPEVQKTVAWVEGVAAVLVYGSGLFVASFYGALSDRKGRVPVLKITFIGYMFLALCFIIMSLYPITNLSVFLIFFGPLVHGLLAGGSIMLANLQAYLSDCAKPTQRTLVFSYLLAAIFLGSTFGPVCASFLLKMTGKTESIFYALFVIYFLLYLYTAYLLPESVDFSALHRHATTSDADITNNHPASTTKEDDQDDMRKIIEKLNIFSSMKIFKEAHISTLAFYAGIVLAVIQFLIQTSSLPPVILYGMLKFGWTSYEGGIYYSVTSVAKLVISIVILPVLTKVFDTSNVSFDIWMIRIGIISDVLRTLSQGFAVNSIQYTIGGSLEAMSLFSQPSMRSLLISMVNPSQVGELMGALGIIDGLAILISQLGIKGIYSATVSIMPNFTFFLCAFFSIIALSLSFSIRKLTIRRTDLDV